MTHLQVGGVFLYSDWGHVIIEGNFYNNIMLQKTPFLNTTSFRSVVTQEAATMGALLQYRALKQAMLDILHHVPSTITKPIITEV